MHLLDPMEIQSVGGGGLDSYTNLHEGDGNGTTAYGIR